jgi:hypothetical protein
LVDESFTWVLDDVAVSSLEHPHIHRAFYMPFISTPSVPFMVISYKYCSTIISQAL